jgi:hypothetical protein
MSSHAYRVARERSDGRCEVMVSTGLIWDRCPHDATDVHHALPRSRGGLLLDLAKESYHLICVCRGHHSLAHGNPTKAIYSGLTIEGFVVTDKNTLRPVYTGPDHFLSQRYGPNRGTNHVIEEAVGGGSAHHTAPRPLAGPARRRPAAEVGRGLGRRATDHAPEKP